VNPRAPARPFRVTVREVRPESHDAVSLLLEPHTPVLYEAGQFLTIEPRQFPALAGAIADLEAKKGTPERVRAYSLASAPHDPLLRVTVKREPEGGAHPPLLSPYLVREVRTGDELEVVGFSGMFTLRHVVLCANKTHADVLFREEWAALARAFPDRLRLTHWLSREPEAAHLGPGWRYGRLGASAVAEAIADPARTVAYVCGPSVTMHARKAALARGEKSAPLFLEQSVAWLQAAGVPRKQIHQESFG
jgi:ferredoxin-NADP reductase